MKRKINGSKSRKVAASSLAKGFKVVSAPKSAARREMLSAQDIAASGGARTVQTRVAH